MSIKVDIGGQSKNVDLDAIFARVDKSKHGDSQLLLKNNGSASHRGSMRVGWAEPEEYTDTTKAFIEAIKQQRDKYASALSENEVDAIVKFFFVKNTTADKVEYKPLTVRTVREFKENLEGANAINTSPKASQDDQIRGRLVNRADVNEKCNKMNNESKEEFNKCLDKLLNRLTNKLVDPNCKITEKHAKEIIDNVLLVCFNSVNPTPKTIAKTFRDRLEFESDVFEKKELKTEFISDEEVADQFLGEIAKSNEQKEVDEIKNLPENQGLDAAGLAEKVKESKMNKDIEEQANSFKDFITECENCGMVPYVMTISNEAKNEFLNLSNKVAEALVRYNADPTHDKIKPEDVVAKALADSDIDSFGKFYDKLVGLNDISADWLANLNAVGVTKKAMDNLDKEFIKKDDPKVSEESKVPVKSEEEIAAEKAKEAAIKWIDTKNERDAKINKLRKGVDGMDKQISNLKTFDFTTKLNFGINFQNGLRDTIIDLVVANSMSKYEKFEKDAEELNEKGDGFKMSDVEVSTTAKEISGWVLHKIKSNVSTIHNLLLAREADNDGKKVDSAEEFLQHILPTIMTAPTESFNHELAEKIQHSCCEAMLKEITDAKFNDVNNASISDMATKIITKAKMKVSLDVINSKRVALTDLQKNEAHSSEIITLVNSYKDVSHHTSQEFMVYVNETTKLD